MTYERFHATFVGVVATLVDSIVVAELAGYWLHRLLHSDKFPALGRGHLIHHFLIYGPRHPMRAAEYHDATDHRFSAGNVGLEWLVSLAIILLFCWGGMLLLGAPHIYQILAISTSLGWPIFMFNYLHDGMHLEHFWVIRVPFLRTWFLNARRLHDIHHRSVNSEGFMDKNFGIGFYFFDRLFRTLAKRHRPFNWTGYRTAIERYGLDEAELVPLRRFSEALFHKPNKHVSRPPKASSLRRTRQSIFPNRVAGPPAGQGVPPRRHHLLPYVQTTWALLCCHFSPNRG